MSPYLRPILAFIFMAVLAAQTLTRFLDTLPGGSVSNDVHGINALLDFVLVSRIDVGHSKKDLAAGRFDMVTTQVSN